MSMQFTVDITGTVRMDLSTSIGIDADEALADATYSSSVTYENAEVIDATITIEALARYEGYEVEASDLGDFDAESALAEGIDQYGVDVRSAEFEVTDSPSGFNEVENIVGREQAIEVYAALAQAGFEVS